MTDVIGAAFIDIRARTAGFDRQLAVATRTGMGAAATEVRAGSRAVQAETAAMATSMSSRFGLAATAIDRKMTGAFRNVRREMGAFLPSMKLAIPAAIIGVGVASVHMAGDFQTAMTQLVTGAGESQRAIGMVSRGVEDMSVNVGAKATDLAHGLYMIESAGFHGARGLNVLEKSSQGAKVGAADMETVADAVTTALNAYDRPASAAAKVTNTLIETVKAGKTHLQDLAGSLGQVLPSAAALHVPFTQVAGAMATMTSQGTNANKASTSLRFLFNALVAPTSSATKTLKAFGLSAVDVGTTMTKKGLGPALTQITDAVGAKFPVGSAKYIAAMSHMVGGTRGMMAALELTGKHAEKFAGNVDTITGRVHRAGDEVSGWRKIQQTFNQQLDVAKAQIENVGIKIGTALLPKVTDATIGLGNFADGLDGSAKKSTAASQAGIAVGRVWREQVKPALVTIGDILKSVTGFFSDHIGIVKAVVAVYIGYRAAVLSLRVVEGVSAGISRMSGAMASGRTAAGRFAGATSSVAARVAGGAGAGAMGGPVGLVLTAALTLGTIAIGHFMHKSAQAKARVDELADSLNQETGAITHNTIAAAAKRLQDNGALEVAKKYGLSIHDVTLASVGNEKATARVTKQVQALRHAHRMGDLDAIKVIGNIENMNKDLGKARDKTQELAEATGETQKRTRADIAASRQAYDRGTAAFTTFGTKQALMTKQFVGNMKKLPDSTASAINGLVGAVEKGKSRAGPAAHHLAHVLLSSVPPNLLTDAGRALVDGLIASINAKTDAVVNSMVQLGGAAAAGFKRANDSQSPSRLYRRLMDMNIDGMLLSVATRRGEVEAAVASLGQLGMRAWGPHASTQAHHGGGHHGGGHGGGTIIMSGPGGQQFRIPASYMPNIARMIASPVGTDWRDTFPGMRRTLTQARHAVHDLIRPTRRAEHAADVATARRKDADAAVHENERMQHSTQRRIDRLKRDQDAELGGITKHIDRLRDDEAAVKGTGKAADAARKAIADHIAALERRASHIRHSGDNEKEVKRAEARLRHLEHERHALDRAAAAAGRYEDKMSRAADRIDEKMSKAKAAVGAATKAIRDAVKAQVQEVTDAFRTSTTEGTDLPALFNYQAGYGGSSVATIEAALRARIRLTKQFGATLRLLTRKGLDHDMILQLIQAGPQVGMAIARELLADPNAILTINNLEAQLASASASEAGLLAKSETSHAATFGHPKRHRRANGAASDRLERVGGMKGIGGPPGSLMAIHGDLHIREEADVRRLSHALYVQALAQSRATGAAKNY